MRPRQNGAARNRDAPAVAQGHTTPMRHTGGEAGETAAGEDEAGFEMLPFLQHFSLFVVEQKSDY